MTRLAPEKLPAACADYCRRELGLTPDRRLLLAVSGGLDSVVMVDLMHKAGYAFAIAHVNFQLRMQESDDDEAFVRELAKRYDVPCYVNKVETTRIAAQLQMGIQEAARHIRYTWFQELVAEHHYDYIATAHHLDDNLETILFQLTRSAGLFGLRGIPPVNGNIIRPLLFTDRRALMAFAAMYGIRWREDSSNLSIKYKRNLIRRRAVPVLENINPDIAYAAGETSRYLRESAALYRDAVALWAERAVSTRPDQSATEIDLSVIRSHPAFATLLYEFLQPYGFTTALTAGVVRIADAAPGASIASYTHQCYKDRDLLIIVPYAGTVDPMIHQVDLSSAETIVDLIDGRQLTFRMLDQVPARYPTDPHLVYMDVSSLVLPLTVEPYAEGDRFCPLGMRRRSQKVKDFLINQKISVPDKKRIRVIKDAKGKICWVVGYRLDDRVKLTELTTRVCAVELGNRV